MADDTEFRFVTASVRRAVRLQREYADSYLETVEAGQRMIGEQFADLCAQIDAVLDGYEHRYTNTHDELDRRVVLNAVRELLAWTRDLQSRRAWLDAAASPPIDLGSFYYLSGIARAIVRDDSELTVVAAHEGSYATIVNPFRAPQHPVPHGIVLVALLPHRETRSGLLHPLLVHEIGHGVAKVHGHTDTLKGVLGSGAVAEALDRGARERAAVSGRTAAEEHAILDKRFAAWIEEVFCDAIASACLGATYLFSFATEVLPDEADVAGPKHPPNRQRVRLILEHLDRLGWGAILDAQVPEFTGWLRDLAAGEPVPQSSDDEALRTAIDLSARQIQDAVDAHVGDRLVEPNSGILATVEALLEQRVPPAQSEEGAAIDRAMVIAGCWLAAMRDRGGTMDALADAVDSPELRELLPYALELSVIVDRWEQA